MIFEPYADELEVINNIHKYNESEYVVIRLTETMIKKNNPDANVLLRNLLNYNNLVDYDELPLGGNMGIKLLADFVLDDSLTTIKMNFYRVNNSRGDRRFSIHGMSTFFREKKLNVGDLLYITVNNSKDTSTITVMNVTQHRPTTKVLMTLFGIDKIEDSLSRLIPKVRLIASHGYHLNSKGPGKAVPKDSGDTLESLLGIKTNNSQEPDFEETIELKTKTGRTMDTLFTLRPQFVGTPVAEFETEDRSRVSAFARLYGYKSDKRPEFKSLYITIGSEEVPQNSLSFYLVVNEEDQLVELRKKIDVRKSILTAYWSFDTLEKELYKKHPATLWVKTEMKMFDDTVGFKYVEAELSRSPQFATFLSLIKTGGITYDWRGYTTPEGPYKGKNHGNAWRIKNKQRHLLFGSMEKIDLEKKEELLSSSSY